MPTVVPARKKRPTVSDVKSLQDQLSISQVSSAKQISLLRQQLATQAQAFTAERDEMRKFMTDMMKRQRGELVEETVRSEPLPVIDMVDDASVTSEFSYLTGDSEGHSTVGLSNVQVVMAPDSSTNGPTPTTLARKDVAVPPKDTLTGVVATQGRPHVPTVTTLPPQVRVPIVSSATQPFTVAQRDNRKQWFPIRHMFLSLRRSSESRR